MRVEEIDGFINTPSTVFWNQTVACDGQTMDKEEWTKDMTGTKKKRVKM